MDSGRGRFQRTQAAEKARRGLRSDLLALRRELELLDDVLRTGSTPLSARASLDRAFFTLRGAERSWHTSSEARDLLRVAEQLAAARDALDLALEALERRRSQTRGR